MEPLPNQQFSHDAIKFVYQQPDAIIVPGPPPTKEFIVKSSEKSQKSKKDHEKNRDQKAA